MIKSSTFGKSGAKPFSKILAKKVAQNTCQKYLPKILASFAPLFSKVEKVEKVKKVEKVEKVDLYKNNY